MLACYTRQTGVMLHHQLTWHHTRCLCISATVDIQLCIVSLAWLWGLEA